jgi:hypothetical protein
MAQLYEYNVHLMEWYWNILYAFFSTVIKSGMTFDLYLLHLSYTSHVQCRYYDT